MGESAFVQVAEKVGGEIMELPVESDGTVLLTTLHAQFPNAIGLKYKSSSGGWRGVRAADKYLDAPHEGWEDTVFIITESSALKRAASDGVNGSVSKSRKPNLLDDIIVLGLPYATTEEDFASYFADNCGEVAFHELKYNRETKKSRGFGFIRFKTEEAAKEALNGKHSIDGRKLEIRLSKQQEANPTRLFVGRLPQETTDEDLRVHFGEYGELADVFVPKPFRGIGFVTFTCQEDASNAIHDGHTLKGASLNVTPAEPKGPKDKPTGGQMNNAINNAQWNSNSYGGGMNYGMPENPMRLFIGRLPHGTSQQEVNEYFCRFGPLSDVFVPNTTRGIGFVTYTYQQDAMRVLSMNHTIQGATLNVKVAEAKKGESPQDIPQQDKSGNYSWDPSSLSGKPAPQLGFQGGPPAQKDVTSEIKDLLITLINKR